MKRLLYIITIGLSLTACDMDKYPLDAVSPDTFLIRKTICGFILILFMTHCPVLVIFMVRQ